MKLNRKQRRSRERGNWRQPSPNDSPQQQFRDFLAAPGKMYIINLPGKKSTVMKVGETDEPFFRMFCAQLQGVLGGEFQVIPATPLDAKIADTQMIAEDTAVASKRIRAARQRQAKAEALRAETDDLNDALNDPTLDEQIDAAIDRHPAGKQRPGSGRHRKAEPDTTFDKLVAAGPVDSDEGARRLASMEIAAAQDQVARAQDQLEEANQRLRDAYDRGGELHNRSVLDKFSEQASQAFAEQAEQMSATQEVGKDGGQRANAWGNNPDAPSITYAHPDAQEAYPQWNISEGTGRIEAESIDAAEPLSSQTLQCPFCPAEIAGYGKAALMETFSAHVQQHRRQAGISDAAP